MGMARFYMNLRYRDRLFVDECGDELADEHAVLGHALDTARDLIAYARMNTGAARLAAIPAGESPANRGVQCCCSHIQRREGRPTRRKPGCKSPRWPGSPGQIRPGGRAT